MQEKLHRGARLLFPALGILILILDSKTALNCAAQGVQLCIRTVIPSLFPYFYLSGILTNAVFILQRTRVSRLHRILGIPAGSEGILIAGLLGGYPVGAQCVAQAYQEGRLSRNTARRMLGFCSNAGPAFLFGMVMPMFSTGVAPALLWGIHILSALIAALLLPRRGALLPAASHKRSASAGNSIQRSITAMAQVCGWIVLFRVLIGFCQRWFLWLLPEAAQVLLCGLLELSNGCLALSAISDEGLRFVMASVFLAFGGVCVLMQTAGATSRDNLGTGLYLPGKLLQTGVSLLLSWAVAGVCYRGVPWYSLLIPGAAITFLCIFLRQYENNGSIAKEHGV